MADRLPYLVADYAWWRPPSVGALRDDGIAGVVRYITGSGKRIDALEYRWLQDGGLMVALVMETFAQAAARGYGQGFAEAKQAFAAADSIGWPPERPIYFVAEDPSPVSRGAWPDVAAYFEAVHDFDPRRPRPGAYGSGDLCGYLADRGLAGNRWHVSTWPGGRSGATIVQEANGVAGHSTFGGEVDLNTVWADDWGQVPGPHPTPKEDDDDMKTLLFWHARALYWCNGINRSPWGLDPGVADAYIRSGVAVAGAPDDNRQGTMDSMIAVEPWAGGHGVGLDPLDRSEVDAIARAAPSDPYPNGYDDKTVQSLVALSR
jgi:hypothetical protein